MASAIVLLNFGGPRDLGEVSDFLFEKLFGQVLAERFFVVRSLRLCSEYA